MPKNVKKTTSDFLKLNILHLNCQGLAGEDRLSELENACRNIKFDVIGMSEVKRRGEALIQRENGNLFFYFEDTPGFRGWDFI